MSQVIPPVLDPNSDSPESIGIELREALHTVRIQTLSLHDAEGDLLWLSEGVLGPDEHSAVFDSMSSHALQPGHSIVERPLGDGRNALLLPARTHAGEVVGVAMLIQDAESASPTLKTKLSDPRLQAALAKLAARQQSLTGLHPALKLGAPDIPARGVEAADEPELALAADDGFVRVTAPPSELKSLAEAKPGAEERAAMSALGHRAVSARPAAADALPHSRLVGSREAADGRAGAASSDRQDLILVVQRLHPLCPQGDTHRYEVLLRSRKEPTRKALPDALLHAVTASDSSFAVDRYVLNELVTWLGKHRGVWESELVSFTINMAPRTLADQGFLPLAAALVEEWNIRPGLVGFEIPERACIEASGEIRSFIETCEKLGFFFMLDDFLMHSAAVPLLGSPALRLIKIDSRLTCSALKVKLSRALVLAISQAAKVLGVHCVAKRVDSRITAQWLASIGIGYAQGHELERLGSLDSLLAGPGGTPAGSKQYAYAC